MAAINLWLTGHRNRLVAGTILLAGLAASVSLAREPNRRDLYRPVSIRTVESLDNGVAVPEPPDRVVNTRYGLSFNTFGLPVSADTALEGGSTALELTWSYRLGGADCPQMTIVIRDPSMVAKQKPSLALEWAEPPWTQAQHLWEDQSGTKAASPTTTTIAGLTAWRINSDQEELLLLDRGDGTILVTKPLGEPLFENVLSSMRIEEREDER